MPSCYWRQCDCPTDAPNPCSQHHGVNCGQWNGQNVRSVLQINDGFTASLATFLQGLQTSENELTRLKVEVEQVKAEMERENAEIEALRNSPDSYSTRRAILQKAEEAGEKLRQRRDRMLVIIEAADMTFQQESAFTISGFMSSLQAPYDDPSAFCSCYQVKLARLTQLEATITANFDQLQRLELGTIPALKTASKTAWLALVPPALAGIIFVIHFVAYLFGFLGPPGLVLLIIGLAIAAVLLLAALIYYLSKLLEAMELRRRLVTDILLYYRIQQISTCQLPVLDEPIDEEGEEDGNDEDEEDDGSHEHGSSGSRQTQKPLG